MRNKPNLTSALLNVTTCKRKCYVNSPAKEQGNRNAAQIGVYLDSSGESRESILQIYPEPNQLKGFFANDVAEIISKNSSFLLAELQFVL
jgi:hypothetical protein